MTGGTWGEALFDAHDAVRWAHGLVGEAERRRGAVIAGALDAGLSTRQIGGLLGVSASTVLRWGGVSAPRQKVSLDAPSPGQQAEPEGS